MTSALNHARNVDNVLLPNGGTIKSIAEKTETTTITDATIELAHPLIDPETGGVIDSVNTYGFYYIEKESIYICPTPAGYVFYKFEAPGDVSSISFGGSWNLEMANGMPNYIFHDGFPWSGSAGWNEYKIIRVATVDEYPHVASIAAFETYQGFIVSNGNAPSWHYNYGGVSELRKLATLNYGDPISFTKNELAIRGHMISAKKVHFYMPIQFEEARRFGGLEGDWEVVTGEHGYVRNGLVSADFSNTTVNSKHQISMLLTISDGAGIDDGPFNATHGPYYLKPTAANTSKILTIT